MQQFLQDLRTASKFVDRRKEIIRADAESLAAYAACMDGTSTDTPNTLKPGTLEGTALRGGIEVAKMNLSGLRLHHVGPGTG